MTVLLGDTSTESTTDSNPAGTAQAYQFTATASGTAATIHVYIDSSSAATHADLGIYDNSQFNQPGTALARVSFLPSAGWNSVDISGQNLSIVSGTVYWLALMGDDDTLAYRDAGSGTPASSVESGLAKMPATWSETERWDVGNASVYVSS